MGKLILLRHGESLWNKRNLFTGWVDVPLSEKGIKEAIEAGNVIKEIPIHAIYCSTLNRAITTAMLAMSVREDNKTPVIIHRTGQLHTFGAIHSDEEMKNVIPVILNDALNERMYGKLQGLNKQKMRDIYGDEQVKIWRRSFSEPPPEGESLEMTTKRAIPYFTKTIIPHVEKGENILVSAHGNSIRGIIKFLDNLTDEEVVHLEIATGVPLFYQYDGKTISKV